MQEERVSSTQEWKSQTPVQLGPNTRCWVTGWEGAGLAAPAAVGNCFSLNGWPRTLAVDTAQDVRKLVRLKNSIR